MDYGFDPRMEVVKMRWMHLSDIHFHNIQDMDTKKLREELIEFVYKKHIKVDHLFITGDFCYAPNFNKAVSSETPDEKMEKDAKDVTEYIIELAKSVGIVKKNSKGTVDVNKDRIHIVPGNHDLTRGSYHNEEKIVKLRESIYRPGNGRFYLKGECNQESEIKQLGALFGRFVFFQKVVEKLYEKDSEKRTKWKRALSHDNSPQKSNPHFIEHIEDDQDNYSILYLNTALTSTVKKKNKDKSGKETPDKGEEVEKRIENLIVGAQYIEDALIEIEKSWETRTRDKAIIILAHHNIACFRPVEREKFIKLLQDHENKKWVYLCGHTHNTKVDYEIERDFHQITMGSLEIGEQAQNTVSVCEFVRGSLAILQTYKWTETGRRWSLWDFGAESLYDVRRYEREFLSQVNRIFNNILKRREKKYFIQKDRITETMIRDFFNDIFSFLDIRIVYDEKLKSYYDVQDIHELLYDFLSSYDVIQEICERSFLPKSDSDANEFEDIYKVWTKMICEDSNSDSDDGYHDYKDACKAWIDILCSNLREIWNEQYRKRIDFYDAFNKFDEEGQNNNEKPLRIKGTFSHTIYKAVKKICKKIWACTQDECVQIRTMSTQASHKKVIALYNEYLFNSTKNDVSTRQSEEILAEEWIDRIERLSNPSPTNEDGKRLSIKEKPLLILQIINHLEQLSCSLKCDPILIPVYVDGSDITSSNSLFKIISEALTFCIKEEGKVGAEYLHIANVKYIIILDNFNLATQQEEINKVRECQKNCFFIVFEKPEKQIKLPFCGIQTQQDIDEYSEFIDGHIEEGNDEKKRLPVVSSSSIEMKTDWQSTVQELKKIFKSIRESQEISKCVISAEKLPSIAGIVIGYGLHDNNHISLVFEEAGKEYGFVNDGKTANYSKHESHIPNYANVNGEINICFCVQMKETKKIKIPFHSLAKNRVSQEIKIKIDKKRKPSGAVIINGISPALKSKMEYCFEYVFQKSENADTIDMKGTAHVLLRDIEAKYNEIQSSHSDRDVNLHMIYDGFMGLAVMIGHVMPQTVGITLLEFNEAEMVLKETLCLNSATFR